MSSANDNSPTNATAGQEPDSPTSLGYASSDHVSAGSDLFSRSTSSGSSQSSHLDDPAPRDIGRGGNTPLASAPAPSSAPAEAVASCHANPSSGEGQSSADGPVDGVAAAHLSPNGGDNAHTSTSPHDPRVPVPSAVAQLPKRETALDTLKSKGQEIPEYVLALQSDITEEMVRLATDVQKHVVAVDGSHDARVKALEERLVAFQRSVGGHFATVQRRLETIGGGVGNLEQHVMGDRQAGAGSTNILGAMRWHFAEAARKGEQRSTESTQAMKQHIAESTRALEQRLDARLTEFKDEMFGSFTQLKQDVGVQIREELGGEKRKYESSLALQAFADAALDEADATVMERVRMLFDYMDELSMNFPPTLTPSGTPIPAPLSPVTASPAPTPTPVAASPAPALTPPVPVPVPAPAPAPSSSLAPASRALAPPPPLASRAPVPASPAPALTPHVPAPASSLAPASRALAPPPPPASRAPAPASLAHASPTSRVPASTAPHAYAPPLPAPFVPVSVRTPAPDLATAPGPDPGPTISTGGSPPPVSTDVTQDGLEGGVTNDLGQSPRQRPFRLDSWAKAMMRVLVTFIGKN